tara:strand:- start:11955 stop:12326 length:372 start_codon:yes stop_codon:yes gene_type:complete
MDDEVQIYDEAQGQDDNKPDRYSIRRVRIGKGSSLGPWGYGYEKLRVDSRICRIPGGTYGSLESLAREMVDTEKMEDYELEGDSSQRPVISSFRGVITQIGRDVTDEELGDLVLLINHFKAKR